MRLLPHIIESGDGIFFCGIGGFRLGENSDFGIINPTARTGRSKVIRKSEVLSRASRKPDYWIAVDRDRDARGLFGIYQAVQQDFWKALDDHRRPGLKWESRPGTTK
jgi:hypothetical protein